MSYTSLYRKFRPLKFEDIVGQGHIIQTLKNQVIADRVGHAYLFNGGRGTGKTTAAKILSRAVNCLNPQNGEPCNECEICKANLEGSLTDVVEMDAASNNGVDDIRAIRDEVNFLPTVAKYRVYIIDEVHMLSPGAFNALLKTLEEPPAHVKFILATTEPQKLPATILSRCQRFDFRKIANEDIQKRLQYVCQENKIEITEDALRIIANLAEGAMRDALSILERCAQEDSGKIDDSKVKELVGIPELSQIHKLVEKIFAYEPTEALQVVDEVLGQGKDLNNFLWEIVKYLKDLLVYQTTGKAELYNQEETDQMKQVLNGIEKERIIQTIYQLSEVENEMKWSTQRTILFQVGIVKVATKQEQGDLTSLQARIQELENKITDLQKGGVVIHKTEKNMDNRVAKSASEGKEEVPKSTNELKGTGSWSNVINQLKASGKVMLFTNLMNTRAVELNDMTIGIEFPNGLTSFGKTILEKSENMNELRRLLSIEYGKEMQVKLIDKKKEEAQPKEEDFSNEIDIPIHIVDE